MFDLKITGGTVVDGTGADRFDALIVATIANVRGRGAQIFLDELRAVARELDDTRALTLSPDLSDALARVWTTSTAARPRVEASTVAAIAATVVRRLEIHRRARSASGSRQADTGSSASQRSSSSARAWADEYRSDGRRAMAFKTIAWSAAGTRGLAWRGGAKSPRRTRARICWTSRSSIAGLPVTRQYKVAPRQ